MRISDVIALGSFIVSLVVAVLTGWDRVERRIKGQANKISAWRSVTQRMDNAVIINNVSDGPVYNVVLAYSVPNKGYPILIPGRDPKNSMFIRIVPPGAYVTYFSSNGLEGMSARPEIEIAFMDADGRCWLRDGVGRLHRIWPKYPMTFSRGKILFQRASVQDYMKIELPEIEGKM